MGDGLPGGWDGSARRGWPASPRVFGNSIIKKHSLSGNHLINDSVTGKQVKESRLGQVPSAKLADALNGVQIVAGPTIANNADSQDARGLPDGDAGRRRRSAEQRPPMVGSLIAARNDTFHVYVVCVNGSVTGTP